MIYDSDGDLNDSKGLVIQDSSEDEDEDERRTTFQKDKYPLIKSRNRKTTQNSNPRIGRQDLVDARHCEHERCWSLEQIQSAY